ncbi:hypothetical protein LOTGIDRAFT_161509 [Lottia gigantea]|uniref:G-protein coupled receptors family 3 profile domain-containing protein n=1 Tax=Lottia gigantea TaxID=225164 RepID=V4AL08_LOTGI|nr:hypothetical protein LOTGIDRAFT_161509 [Lottia gigantea]ESO94286.1 hypothetical protein LOTGIDRAFT_161509 [Lottia gigantea]
MKYHLLSEAKKALEYVNRVENSKCTGGTEDVLNLVFNTTVWKAYTDAAIRTANILSSFIQIHGDLNQQEEDFFYTLVRNNVHGDTLIIGSAIALEPGLFNSYPRYCPYALKENGTVKAFDIAVNYNYLTTSTEWYNVVRSKDFTAATIKTDLITYNESSATLTEVEFDQPTAKYNDGHWTFPYFDCGGGNIWMVTYSSPIFYIDTNRSILFRGVATIDIELTNVDINQCDLEEGATKGALDVFRGTHNCQATTKCVPLLGQGFRRGAYLCECQRGFYYPVDSPVRAYSGYEIETYVDKYFQQVEIPFRCVRCARGCDSCVDATPCLYPLDIGIRLFVVLFTIIMIIGCGVVSLLIFKYKHEMVMKTASPIFLHLMCFGAILMCCQIFIAYLEPTDILCMIEIWPLHLGFSVMFGALIIKTWRISVIFGVGSVKRVNLPDSALLKRLLPLIFVFILLITIWTGTNPPRVEILTLTNSLKFYSCSVTWCNYTMYGIEALLLLFGVYLCFTVRKAPAHFNESKHITWAVYNAIILGSFIIILTQFMSESGGPDILYLLLLAQLQVFITITIALIFIPKFWAIRNGTRPEVNNGAVTTITGRVKSQMPTTVSNMRADVRSIAVQTDDITLEMPLTPSNSFKTSKYSSKVSPLLEVPANNYTNPEHVNELETTNDKTPDKIV